MGCATERFAIALQWEAFGCVPCEFGRFFFYNAGAVGGCHCPGFTRLRVLLHCGTARNNDATLTTLRHCFGKLSLEILPTVTDFWRVFPSLEVDKNHEQGCWILPNSSTANGSLTIEYPVESSPLKA